MQNTNNIEFENVNDIPIAFCRPNENESNNSLAFWIPYLGGDKESCLKELQKLASFGYLAISIDPWLHGERKRDMKEDVRTLVLKDFRYYMWQILGITTMDAFRIADWAINAFNLTDNIVAGGVSMGGDIAIALAGIDARVSKVAAIASSPNWERPGMTDVMDAITIINQGKSSSYGKWLYNKLNPMSNLYSFGRPLKLHVELGELDTHIHPEWMLDFKRILCDYYALAKFNFEIVINIGATHISLVQSKEIIDRAVDFFN